MAKKLLLVVAVLVMLTVLLVACGGEEVTTPETTTTKAPTQQTTVDNTNTTTQPVVTTTTPTTTTPTTTTPAVPETTVAPTELDLLIDDSVWLGDIHMGVTIGPKQDKTNPSVEHPYVFHFGYKSEGGHFINDAETATPGIQYTTPNCIFIKNIDKDADYVKYDIEYYETADWWQIWASAKGFVPEDGASYLIYLFIDTDADHAVEPETPHFFATWEDEPFVYDAPDPIVSGYGDINTMVPDIGDRTQLFFHDAFTVDTNGNVRFTFKSDNLPFTNGTDTPGLAYTLMGKLFINGEEYQIVTDSYVTEQWYIITFQIANFNLTEGETYEILFTVNSNDETGTYCNNPHGYFVLKTDVTVTAPAV